MIPGSDYVYKCPNCGNLLKKGSLISGNTFDMKIFSDGKRIAPNLPDFPDITKCKKCNSIFWLSKLKKIGTFDGDATKNPDWANADKAEFLDIDDFFNALETANARNKNDELIIRQQLLWAFNDRIRDGKNLFNDENDEIRWKDNINKLLNILDKSDLNQKIMIAEINRNLGKFENCIRIINEIENDKYNWLKEKFIKECKRKNKKVIELN